MRPSSPLLDSVRDHFDGQEQLAKDFTRAFANLDGIFPEETKTRSTTAISKVGEKIKKSSFRSKKKPPALHLQALKRDEMAESFDSTYKKDTTFTGLEQKLDCGSTDNLTMHLFDVTFMVGQGKIKTKLFGVRAILGVRSR